MERQTQRARLLRWTSDPDFAPHPAGHGVGMPAAYNAYGGFNFLANPRGELFIFVRNKVVTFDLSLEPEAETERLDLDRQLIRANP
jgi:hypothetical protein